MNEVSAFQRAAFVKLFRLFQKKYFSLGSMRGTVSLKEFTAEEIEEIAGFLGVSNSMLERKAAVSLKEFEGKLATSAFAYLTLVQLVEAVLQEKLQTKEQVQLEKEQAASEFGEQLREVLQLFPEWLAQIDKRGPDSRFIWQQQGEVLPEIERTARAVSDRLPDNQFERLPIFAQRTTGNPHAFDASTLAGKLLVHAAYSLGSEQAVYPKTTEERAEVLASLQIVQDDLWSFVTLQGLHGFTDGGLHPLWKAAAETASAVNMPMRELMKIDRVQPVSGQIVWVVENSSVASTLMDADSAASIICTHGQLRLAGWRLLDLLPCELEIYYSGDMDPEGLQIAQKITERYGGRVRLWQMNEANYDAGKSEVLAAERLMKLDRVTVLPGVVERMRECRQAAYQEAWLELMIEDIHCAQ